MQNTYIFFGVRRQILVIKAAAFWADYFPESLFIMEEYMENWILNKPTLREKNAQPT